MQQKSPPISDIPPIDHKQNHTTSCQITPTNDDGSIRRRYRESSLAIPTIGSILKSSNRDNIERSNRISLPEDVDEIKCSHEIKNISGDNILSIPDISEQEVRNYILCHFF